MPEGEGASGTPAPEPDTREAKLEELQSLFPYLPMEADARGQEVQGAVQASPESPGATQAPEQGGQTRHASRCWHTLC